MAVAGGQLHNLGTCPFKSSTLEPSTREQLRLLGKSIACWAIVVTCVQRTWQGCGAKRELSDSLLQENKKVPLKLCKSAETNFIWARDIQMEGHRLQPGNDPEHPPFPKRMECKDRHQPGAVSIPLLLTSCFDGLRLCTLAAVFCRVLNP